MQKSTKITFLLFLLTGVLYYMYVDGLIISGNAISSNEFLQVKRIIDGDTIELNNSQIVRLAGINTPEKKSFYSGEAINFTKSLENKTITLEIIEKDKYGRTIGYIFLNNENFNEKIIERGFAHAYYYNENKYTKNILKLEKSARENHLGIWKKSNNFGCIEIIKFEYYDKNEDNETLILQNNCNINLEIEIKDDATHVYKEKIQANSQFTKITKDVWNDDKDTIFIWDKTGLLLFYRY